MTGNRNAFLTAVFAVLAIALGACSGPRIPAPVINAGSQQAGDKPGVQTPGGVITVQSGDSLYRIARRHNVGLRALIDTNRIAPPYVIHPGQSLRLPGSGGYTVRAGDTVFAIAETYRIEPGALVKANRLAPPFRLTPGQRLKVPGPRSQETVAETVSAAPDAGDTATDAKPAEPETSSAPPPAQPRQIVRRPPTTSPAARPPALSRSGFIWPVSGKTIARFGSIGKGLKNDGINILAGRGTPVRAIENGVVAYAGNELRGFGNLLLLKHEGGWISAYAHNDMLLVALGDRVSRGQVISRVGSTGSVDEPQLHFELRRGNRAVDPERYLGKQTAENRAAGGS